MIRSPSPVAFANLLLAAGLAALGSHGIVASVLRLPSQATVTALEQGATVGQAHIERARTELESAAAMSDGARVDLAFMLLAGRSDGWEPGKAAREFKAYLAAVPGDSRAWAGLAHAELLQQHRAEALSALKMSILTGPFLPGLLMWRCGAGIDLYGSLDEEGRRLLAGQFRVAAERSARGLVLLAREKKAILTALALLADSPEATQKFTAQLARTP